MQHNLCPASIRWVAFRKNSCYHSHSCYLYRRKPYERLRNDPVTIILLLSLGDFDFIMDFVQLYNQSDLLMLENLIVPQHGLRLRIVEPQSLIDPGE